MKNKLNTFLPLAGLSLCALPLQGQNKPERPNIMVILTDDMGYSDIGCFGSEIKTPNIDRLAQNGVRFTHFYNTARCSPTRASLLTGLYPHQACMGHLASEPYQEPGYVNDLGRNGVTMAEVFKNAGYATYMTGKWHIARDMKMNGNKSNWPRQRGFDRFFGTINGSGSYYDPGTLTSGNTFITPGPDFYYTTAISDTAVKFIREHPTGKPFFFYVAFTAAHWPMHAPETSIQRYKGVYDKGWDETRLARFNKMKKLGIIPGNCVLTERGADVPAWKDESMKEWQARQMETYAAMVDIMDQGVGKIVAALKKKGLFDNTVIFYLHDNGGCAEPQGSDKPEVPLTEEQKILRPVPPDSILQVGKPIYSRDGRFIRRGQGVMAGGPDTWMAYCEPWANVSNTPYRLYKHWVHEGGISSPLIVHWPRGIKAKGELRTEPSHLIDIMATSLDITGAQYPLQYNGNEILPFEGKSLVPAFSGKPVGREFLFWEHEGNRALRSGKWKLVSRTRKVKEFTPADDRNWELYDTDIDPSETENLAAKFPEKVKEMAALWEKEAIRTHAKPWPWSK